MSVVICISSFRLDTKCLRLTARRKQGSASEVASLHSYYTARTNLGDLGPSFCKQCLHFITLLLVLLLPLVLASMLMGPRGYYTTPTPSDSEYCFGSSSQVPGQKRLQCLAPPECASASARRRSWPSAWLTIGRRASGQLVALRGFTYQPGSYAGQTAWIRLPAPPTAPLNTMSKKVLLNFALLAGQVYHLDYADASIRVYVCKAESLPKNNCLRLVARLPILSGLWACDSCVSIGG